MPKIELGFVSIKILHYVLNLIKNETEKCKIITNVVIRWCLFYYWSHCIMQII